MAKEQQQPNKIRLFISYSRRDFGKIEKLYEALSGDDELDVYLDQHDIAAAEDWEQRLDGLIRSSDTILFAVSRDSVASDICHWEIDLATQLNKRIIPVIINDVADEDVPEEIARLNYVFARTDKELIPALQSIGDALKIDIDWIREHTRLADMAHRWEQTSKLGAQPLRGKELEAAEQWLSNQPKDAPAPTELQRKYIYESRKSATKRQRVTVMGSIAAMLIVGVLAGFAFVQRNAAIEGERKAEEALRTATKAANTMVIDLAEGFKDSSVPSNIIESILEKARKLQDALGENFEHDAELQRSKATALSVLGDVYLDLKSLDEAQAVYEENLAIRRKLVTIDESDAEYQFDLSTALNQIGIINTRMGNVDGVIMAYQESLSISQKLVAMDEDNTEWQNGVSVILERIGDLRKQAGDISAALKLYQDGLSIRRYLVTQETSNTHWQHNLSISLNNIGDMKLEMSDYAGALTSYQEELSVVRKLVDVDETNTRWQRGLASSLDDIGFLKQRLGDAQGALEAYQESLVIIRKLVALDESNTKWQRDVSAILNKVGIVKMRLDDEIGAFKSYQESLVIARKLATLDESNTQWQTDISNSLMNIGRLIQRTVDSKGALENYQEALIIRRRLASLDDSNMAWKFDVKTSLDRIGGLKSKIGDKTGAIEAYQEGLNIALHLSKIDETNSKRQSDASLNIYRIFQIYSELKDHSNAYSWGKYLLAHSTVLVSRFPHIKDFSDRKESASEKLAFEAGQYAYQVFFKRNFEMSETLSREAISLDPEYLWLKSNLVHALMFQDKTDEARALYLKHRGETINDKFSWEQAILSDFKDLRNKGLTHPLMDEIEALFRK